MAGRLAPRRALRPPTETTSTHPVRECSPSSASMRYKHSERDSLRPKLPTLKHTSKLNPMAPRPQGPAQPFRGSILIPPLGIPSGDSTAQSPPISSPLHHRPAGPEEVTYPAWCGLLSSLGFLRGGGTIQTRIAISGICRATQVTNAHRSLKHWHFNYDSRPHVTDSLSHLCPSASRSLQLEREPGPVRTI